MATITQWEEYFKKMDVKKLRGTMRALHSLKEDAPMVISEFEGLKFLAVLVEEVYTRRLNNVPRGE